MNLISLFIVVVAFVSLSSSVPAYEQCGGLEWEPKFRQCDKGLICYARSPYYANVSSLMLKKKQKLVIKNYLIILVSTT